MRRYMTSQSQPITKITTQSFNMETLAYILVGLVFLLAGGLIAHGKYLYRQEFKEEVDAMNNDDSIIGVKDYMAALKKIEDHYEGKVNKKFQSKYLNDGYIKRMNKRIGSSIQVLKDIRENEL